jgi:hypothetical protein
MANTMLMLIITFLIFLIAIIITIAGEAEYKVSDEISEKDKVKKDFEEGDK